MDNQENTQLTELKKRIPYNSNIHKTEENYENILDSLLDDSKFIGLSLRYPFEDYSDYELPKQYYNWQLRCCSELYKLAGTKNVQSYSENGLNWTMFRNGLSLDLINEIVPRIGVPKESKEETENV